MSIEIEKITKTNIKVDAVFIREAVKEKIQRDTEILVPEECPISFMAGIDAIEVHGAFICFTTTKE